MKEVSLYWWSEHSMVQTKGPNYEKRLVGTNIYDNQTKLKTQHYLYETYNQS